MFDLVAEFPIRENALKKETFHISGLHISRLVSDYQVNAAGDLLGFEVPLPATAQFADELPADLGIPLAKEFTAAVRGEVEGGRLRLIRKLPGEGGTAGCRRRRWPSAAAGPCCCRCTRWTVRGLAANQHWRTVLIEPLSYFLVPGDPPVVRARVRTRRRSRSVGAGTRRRTVR